MRSRSSTEPHLDRLIRRDQLEAVRASVQQALPVNVLLGLAGFLVALHSGHGAVGGLWFSASTAVNGLRFGLCRAPCAGLAMSPGRAAISEAAAARSIDRQLWLACLAALLSGSVWAFLPVLCDGYTSAQTLFYLTVTCGITAGAVTHGIAYARIPICFITPPLLSVAGYLLAVGGFDRTCLAATVLLYLVALIRSSIATERGFRETSRLKNEATALAEARKAAHASASALAEEMRERATHDGLTGLLNRAGFVQRAEERLAAGAPVCLMLLDLDGFKSVNDVYGHSTGDRVLAEVARRIRVALPVECDAARLGGDEFALVYDSAQVSESPAALAERLIRTVAEPFESFDTGRLGMSIGICHRPADSLTHLLSCADEALYAAKHAGRNHVRLFDDGLSTRLEIRRDGERDLSQALAEGELEVWFQPIFGADGRSVTNLEALVRWHHPVHGWVPPPDLISAAAMAGLTESLLRFILEQVCAMLCALRARGLHDLSVAMNVSPREMAQIAVDEIVLGRLRVLGLPATALEIEITEETALDIEAVQGKLLALSRAGIRMALDDFGTGYSSLASVRQLRADRVKIDRSLVTGLTEAEDKRGLVQAVLGLGRALGLEVVAEGIETADDLATLQAMGCPFMQGYHLGRPQPRDDILRFLDARLGADVQELRLRGA
ncbi:deoxyuridine 5'-triphosphate nucleotidohydrolase [Methylobacterium sp. Leaf123]|uniref:putative bifunctional diguanylate cyclase/phosphodiesterase n=1 Tax=Methylobacterium sp. Leaf123 TaxID=1736264 RepID=UPI0006F83C06|nr:EAL domain-containing protein [Methylobacterium sp. Leaf123]KQQ14784.1 deoxyuridine 5'-triphosphate nucleotidohydrolase [Methylobacterium sp. Leaf123]